MVLVTTLADDRPKTMLGQWHPCEVCGWNGPPVAFTVAPCMGAPHDVPLPSPEDLLRAVGRWW